MQTTSELYNSILLKPYDVETKLDIYTADGKTLVGSYGEDVLVSCMTTGKLFSSPSVGAAVGREIDVKMLMPTETLPRMAMLKPFVRIKYGTDVSEWIQKGVYFIDTRSTDKLTDVLTIHGYDAMLKTEQLYCGSGDVGQWPRTMAAVVNDICSKIGVTLDSRTSISSTYNCQLDTTFSMREYLSHIAAAHAGVFMMTDTGQMRLVPLKHGTAVADLGQNVDLLEQSPALAAYDRVVINVSQESIYAYPVNETTGRTLELECRWGSAEMAQAIHGLVNGFVYQPYETGNALISPAVEVGDAVTIDGKLCGIYQMDITFGALLGVKLAAPSDDEVDHEYHYTSSIEKVKKQLATATAELRVLDDSIEAIVEDVKGNSSKIEQTAEELKARVENAEGMASEAQQTAEGFSQRITDAEGNITEIKVSLEGVVYTSSLADGTTVINGGCITTGTIDANKVNITNLTVTNGNITSLDVGKLTVDGKAISADNPWDTAYHRNVWVAEGTSGGGKITLDGVAAGYAQLSPDGVVLIYGSDASTSTITASWKEIIEVAKGGGTATAVFG